MRALAELRRVTRPGGCVLVVLNGDDHLTEMRAVVRAALGSIGQDPWPPIHKALSLDRGEILLRRVFASVTRHDFVSTLVLPGPEPVVDWVRSMSAAYVATPEQLIPAVISRVPDQPGAAFEVTTHSGCLVCA